jgi:hypothetical protein
MSHDEDPSKRRTYKVGYGKPPEEHQFKPKTRDHADGDAPKRKRRSRAADEPEQVDLARLLAEPVAVRKGGRVEKMDAFEAMLRKQVERAVKNRSVSAIKAVLDVAAEEDLFKISPPAAGGGVVLVPLKTAEDIARCNAIFYPPDDHGRSDPEDDHE